VPQCAYNLSAGLIDSSSIQVYFKYPKNSYTGSSVSYKLRTTDNNKSIVGSSSPLKLTGLSSITSYNLVVDTSMNNGTLITTSSIVTYSTIADPYLTIMYTFDTGKYIKQSTYYDIYNSAKSRYDASAIAIDASFSPTYFKYGNSSFNILLGTRSYINYNRPFTSDSNGLTFSFWYFIPSTATVSLGDANYFFDFGKGVDNYNIFYSIGFSSASPVTLIGDQVFVYNGGTRYSYNVFPTTTTISKGVWHHFALVITTSTIKHYLDTTVTLSTGLTYYPNNITTTSNRIGYTNWSQTSGGGYGYMDNFLVYNRALSAAEITALYNA